MKLHLIGEGNTAEVFAWKEEQVLKLFREGFPRGGVEQEYRINKEIEKLGVSMPKAFELMDYEGRIRIIYERIRGISLLQLIEQHPMRAIKYAKHMARLQYEYHQYNVKGLPSAKSELAHKIQTATQLSQESKEMILKQLDMLPEGTSLYHGDYHPGNIIVDSGRYVILDWMLGAASCPCADVARTFMLLKDAGLPSSMPKAVQFIFRSLRNRMAATYLRYYCKLSGRKEEEIALWRLPIIAARLTEWISDKEKQSFIGEIKEAMIHRT